MNVIEGRKSADGRTSEFIEVLRDKSLDSFSQEEELMWQRGLMLLFPSGLACPVFSREAMDKAIENGARDPTSTLAVVA